MKEYRWEDLRIGLEHDFEVTLTAEMIETFAALSGDTNPLHVDAAYAVAQGFPGPVAFGMLTASFYSRLVGVYLPGRFALLHGMDLHFVSPAHAGDLLLVSGQISFLNDAYHQAEIKARIRRADKVISKAKIRVGLHVA